jgi:outer membrane lipoprotein-sorting protein
MQYARIATKALVVVFAVAIFAAAQSAPGQPDGMDLLKNVELTYGAMNTYSAKVTTTMAMGGSETQGKMNMENSVTITADSTGKFRVESKGMMGMLVVYDGNTMWLYMPTANSYTKLPLDGASSSAQAGAMGGGMFGGANALLEYKNVTMGVKEAKVLRSEKVHVNDSDADCWIVSLEYEPLGSQASAAAQTAGLPAAGDFARSKILWVDKSRYLVYQEDSTSKMILPRTNAPTTIRQKSKVDSITVDEPVSPNVFAFTPPPDATEMDHSESIKQKTQSTPQNQKQL